MPAFIHSIATIVPPFVTSQQQIADFMVAHLNLNEERQHKLKVLYRASGIQQRYSVLEDFSQNLHSRNFFREKAFPSAKPRMELYQKHAIGLAMEAAGEALHIGDTLSGEITHLITVSCTGMYAPGLDIELVQRLGLPTETKRTSINFMGCYASFNALKVAANTVEADADAKVLIVCVELCSIHLQDKTDDDSLLSNAIFGDGAAALILKGIRKDICLELRKFHSDLALQWKHEMGWFIGDYGFEMKLSTKVPAVIEDGIEKLTGRLLENTNLGLEAIDYFAIHPGGKRILEVIEKQLGISKNQNMQAHEVLRQYGNMSSPTVLFVLKKIFDQLGASDHNKYILSFAFGPGLTLESALLKIHTHA
ncbi:MAG: type III polyketide synthase [Ekhidna sp.]|nr:type III polyketide synthase [Ekhidna sp.]MBC6411234.1 type III polyketide synthase [Ekhidna sp.]MBC6427426.1 type III polyketide synthase [Ekhidna sp.]